MTNIEYLINKIEDLLQECEINHFPENINYIKNGLIPELKEELRKDII